MRARAACTHTRTRACTGTYTCTCMRSHARTYACIHIHINAHAHAWLACALSRAKQTHTHVQVFAHLWRTLAVALKRMHGRCLHRFSLRAHICQRAPALKFSHRWSLLHNDGCICSGDERGEWCQCASGLHGWWLRPICALNKQLKCGTLVKRCVGCAYKIQYTSQSFVCMLASMPVCARACVPVCVRVGGCVGVRVRVRGWGVFGCRSHTQMQAHHTLAPSHATWSGRPRRLWAHACAYLPMHPRRTAALHACTHSLARSLAAPPPRRPSLAPTNPCRQCMRPHCPSPCCPPSACWSVLPCTPLRPSVRPQRGVPPQPRAVPPPQRAALPAAQEATHQRTHDNKGRPVGENYYRAFQRCFVNASTGDVVQRFHKTDIVKVRQAAGACVYACCVLAPGAGQPACARVRACCEGAW